MENPIGTTLSLVETEDLLKYGMIPEFIGRLPVIATLDDLDKNALIDILIKPKNALTKQFQQLFYLEKVNLEFKNDALAAIAIKALEKNTGARGLRSIIENKLLDIMFKLPDIKFLEKVIINEDVILGKIEPICIFSEKKSNNISVASGT